jgi:hypothetical protein
MMARARTHPHFSVRVIDSPQRQNGLIQRMADIDAGSPLVHPFQTELFVALFNTDPARPYYAIVAENGDGPVAYWWGYFARYKDGIFPRSTAWVRSGPVVRGDLIDQRDHICSLMLAELKRYVRQQKVGWILITSEALYGAECEAASLAERFQRFDLQTFLIDLTPPEEEVFKRVRARARRAANKARESGVVVQDATSDEDILSYYHIYLESGSAPGYSPPSDESFLRGFRRLHEAGRARIIVAKRDGQVVAGSFFPCHGGFAAQHQHAISAEGRKLNAGSLLIWESIRIFKEAGFSSLDLVSVDVMAPEGSREAGVRQFKSNWGGMLVDTPVYQYWSPVRRAWHTIMRRFRRRKWAAPLSRGEPAAQKEE